MKIKNVNFLNINSNNKVTIMYEILYIYIYKDT